MDIRARSMNNSIQAVMCTYDGGLLRLAYTVPTCKCKLVGHSHLPRFRWLGLCRCMYQEAPRTGQAESLSLKLAAPVACVRLFWSLFHQRSSDQLFDCVVSNSQITSAWHTVVSTIPVSILEMPRRVRLTPLTSRSTIDHYTRLALLSPTVRPTAALPL